MVRRRGDWRRHPREGRSRQHRLRAVGRRRQYRARLQVSRAGRPLSARDGERRRAGHRRISVGQAVRRDHQGVSLQASADVPRPGRAAVDDRRQASRISRRAMSRKSTSRSAACCRTSCSTSRRRCGISSVPSCTRTSKTSSSSASSRPAITAARRRASRPTTASTSATICRERRALDCARGRSAWALPAAHPRTRLAAADHRRRARRRVRRRRARHRGYAAHPRHRPRLHRETGKGWQPRRLRAVDPHGPAGRGRANRDDRQQRPADVDGHHRRHRPRPLAEAVTNRSAKRKDAAPDHGAEGRRRVLHAVRIERARDRLLALRYRRRGKRAVGPAAIGVPVLRSGHLSSRRDHASRTHHANRRLESVAHRPSVGCGDHRSARHCCQPNGHEADGRVVRRSVVHEPSSVADRHLSSGRVSREGRLASRNARQHVVQGAGVRAGSPQGAPRSHRRPYRRLAEVDRRAGARQRAASLRCGRERPPRGRGAQPHSGAAAIHALSGLSFRGRENASPSPIRNRSRPR